MSGAKEFMDRLHYVLTGSRVTALAQDRAQIWTAGAGDLSDCHVIAGYDMIREAGGLKSDLYPFIILEVGPEDWQRGTWTQYRADIDIGVRVPGKWGALFGYTGESRGILEIRDDVIARLMADEALRCDGLANWTLARLLTYNATPQVDYDGMFISRRFVTIAVQYQRDVLY